MISPTTFLDGRVTLYPGDCREIIAGLPDASVDSVVTDPPYHLTTHKMTTPQPIQADYNGGTGNPFCRPQARAGFMGKKWDGGDIAFDPVLWTEVLRVLKPGGHMVAFSGTRTYHRMVCAIEDAGFEIRDQIGWVFGSGFPKSHDVSKGIDKKRDDSADILRVTKFMADAAEAAGLSKSDVDEHMGTSDMGGWWLSRLQHRCQCPRWDQWLLLKSLLDIGEEMDAEVWRLNGRKGSPGEAWDAREVIAVGKPKGKSQGIYGDFAEDEYNYTAPATDEAARWQGWGTALKPAWEPICLARKPLAEGTVAAQVLATGTGAINIDGCRVEHVTVGNGDLAQNPHLRPSIKGGNTRGNIFPAEDDSRFGTPHKSGRWPANLVHDGSEEVLAAFPDTGANGDHPRNNTPEGVNKEHSYGRSKEPWTTGGHMDGGGSAARFFYTVKQDDQSCHSRKPVSDADETLPLPSGRVVSALSNAVAQSTPRLVLHKPSYRAHDTSVSVPQLGLIVASVTEAIQNIERRCAFELPRERLSVRLGPVMCVAIPKQIGTTTITLTLTTSDLCAGPVTFDIIETSEEAGEPDSASKRFHYSAKADSDDRIGSKHPTVKPVDLMRWLCRLITPPGGTCLDPFAGTGTTGEACFYEGFNAILIEREAEYQADIERRMRLVMAGPDERGRESAKARANGKPVDHGPLFDWVSP